MESALCKVLPDGEDFKVIHLQSNPRETHPLVCSSTSSENNDLKTIKIEHFITISHQDTLFFGLEIFIYITIDTIKDTTEKLLFVSKADTTGLNYSKANIGLLTQTIIEYLIKIPISHYLENIIPKESTRIKFSKDSITKFTPTKDSLMILLKRHQGLLQKPTEIKPYKITSFPSNIVIKIALFTRSEKQYLFPGSQGNKDKHILGGEGLLKWWLKVLDKTINNTFKEDAIAKLQIPSEDTKVIGRYLNGLSFNNWSVGDIFHGSQNDVAVYKIPLFPDDPKARFLEHLVVEGRALKISLNQFWAELQGRQEFRLGVTVSVIGVEGELDHWNASNDETTLILSRKHFKKIKGYITGEDYSVEELGGVEALRNCLDYIETHFGIEIRPIKGQYVKPAQPINNLPVKRPVINSLGTNLVRKKSKKV